MKANRYRCTYNTEPVVQDEEEEEICSVCLADPCECDFDEISVQYEPMQTRDGVVDVVEYTRWGPRLV